MGYTVKGQIAAEEPLNMIGDWSSAGVPRSAQNDPS
jgi:hypothetical protein